MFLGWLRLIRLLLVANRVSGFRRKRFRLNRKTPAHLVGCHVHTRPRVWKRLHFSGHLCVSDVDCKRRRYNQQDGGGSPAGLVWVDFGDAQAHVSGLHVVISC